MFKRYKIIKLLKDIYSGEKPDLHKVEEMGILSVKICQYYALRIDFIKEDVCLHLSKLYENSYNSHENTLYSLIKEERGVLEYFSNYDTMPFASASVGQVHMGTLKETLEDVAIKILRRDGEKEFKKDVKKVKSLMKIVLFLNPKLKKVFNPIEALENIEKATLKELDFINEVKGANMFSELKEKNSEEFDLEKLKFSKFYEKLCSSRILVSKYIKGKSFNSLLDEGKLDYKTLLLLFKYHSFYMFKLGVFHGDIHPGNIILDDKGNINLIDCSTVGEISRELQYGLFWFFFFLSRYNYLEAGKCLNKMSLKPIKGESLEEFIDEFLKLYVDFKDKSVSQVSLTKKMMDTIKLGVNSGMEFPQGMFHVIKSLMYLDGMVLKCNPKAILMNDVRKFTTELRRYMRE